MFAAPIVERDMRRVPDSHFDLFQIPKLAAAMLLAEPLAVGSWSMQSFGARSSGVHDGALREAGLLLVFGGETHLHKRLLCSCNQ